MALMAGLMLDIQKTDATMPATQPAIIRREDYRPPTWFIPTIALDFQLGLDHTGVHAIENLDDCHSIIATVRRLLQCAQTRTCAATQLETGEPPARALVSILTKLQAAIWSHYVTDPTNAVTRDLINEYTKVLFTFVSTSRTSHWSCPAF